MAKKIDLGTQVVLRPSFTRYRTYRTDFQIAMKYHKTQIETNETTKKPTMGMQKQEPILRHSAFETANREGDVKVPCTENVSAWTPLPYAFCPTVRDVIVGTGREPRNHQGNKLLPEALRSYVGRYSSAESKLEKTLIISEIVADVKGRSPSGSGFVKKVGGRWYAVDDHACREKVSQGLRNLLHGQYRSSAKFKKRKRGIVVAEMQDSVEQMMMSKRSFLSKSIGNLSSELARRGKDAPDDEVEALFTRTNVAILEGLKATDVCDPFAVAPSFFPPEGASNQVPLVHFHQNVGQCVALRDEKEVNDN